MEAPKCKLCGERHYGMCPVMPASTPEQIDEVVRQAATAGIKYDRNAAHRVYMKKYMRKRRAKPPPAEPSQA